jgi:hypothetical protein
MISHGNAHAAETLHNVLARLHGFVLGVFHHIRESVGEPSGQPVHQGCGHGEQYGAGLTVHGGA